MACRSRRGRRTPSLTGDFSQGEMSWGGSLHQMNRHCGNPVAADRFNPSSFFPVGPTQKAAA
ncbi:hypothetical protein CO656_15465 [Sinorhizobium sp. FG01]|nr:hypothetical protein CO656_15465 [Sinorhizobium sp. FG01]PDT52186.1 hypothetical protein CO664_15210 [Sinorhizobium sp. NG07B]